MRSPISHEIELVYTFLEIVKENPNINQTRILSKMNRSYSTITGLKSVLVGAGFCKISKATTNTSSIEITHDGENLMHYLERLIENSE